MAKMSSAAEPHLRSHADSRGYRSAMSIATLIYSPTLSLCSIVRPGPRFAKQEINASLPVWSRPISPSRRLFWPCFANRWPAPLVSPCLLSLFWALFVYLGQKRGANGGTKTLSTQETIHRSSLWTLRYINNPKRRPTDGFLECLCHPSVVVSPLRCASLIYNL